MTEYLCAYKGKSTQPERGCLWGVISSGPAPGQRYRASALNLIVAAIILWNTVYLERAIIALRGHGVAIDDEALVHLSPSGWEHVNLTGDYTWQASG